MNLNEIVNENDILITMRSEGCLIRSSGFELYLRGSEGFEKVGRLQEINIHAKASEPLVRFSVSLTEIDENTPSELADHIKSIKEKLLQSGISVSPAGNSGEIEKYYEELIEKKVRELEHERKMRLEAEEAAERMENEIYSKIDDTEEGV